MTTYIYNTQAIMSEAWTRAKEFAAEFSEREGRVISPITGRWTHGRVNVGKRRHAREFFPGCLRTAWANHKEARAAAEAADLAAAAAARRASLTKYRALFAVSQLADVARRLPAGAVVDGTGKQFRINSDHPSVWGSHLLGHEGSMGCYVYYYA